MKNSIKKIIAVTAAAVTSVSLLASCGKKDGFKVGVLQFADHPSLDNCVQGFEEGLKSEGVEYELIKQSAKSDATQNQAMAQQLAAQNVDLICGVATPSAQACYNAASESGIPVIFNAVSDPVEAELAKSETEALEGITGVSDKLPVEEQLKLIREMLPDAKTIGILYTTSEANSISTIEDYKEQAGNYGFEIKDKGISNAVEIPQAAAALVAQVDCISNMTDNTVVNNLPVLLEQASAAGIPVFGSEEEQVGNGCIASAGIDYIELGRKAGVMAAKVLKGEKKVSDMPYETMTESKITINPDAAAKLNITIPQSIVDRAETKTTAE